jgi:hypothetical protein
MKPPRSRSRRRGRPGLFSQKLAATICARVAEGQSLRFICGDEDMPSRATVRRWLRDKPDFSNSYARAHEEFADAIFEEILEIADDSQGDYVERETRKGITLVLRAEAVSRSKLRVDTRKWMLARIAPKKYGDKPDANHGAEVVIKVTIGGDV